MLFENDWSEQNEQKVEQKNEQKNKIAIIIKETTIEKTQLTINSLFSKKDIVDEFDYNIPIEKTENNFKKYPIYVIPKTEYFKDNFNIIEEIEKCPTHDSYIIMNGGFYSISLEKINKLKFNKNVPTIFNTIPYGLNFYSENSYIIPSLEYINKLIDLAIVGKIVVNKNIIGIDKNRFLKFFEHPLLSPVRTALVLNTKIDYCYWSFDKLHQLYIAKKSINMKFKDLSKSLKSKKTSDKVIRNYIKLLTSFENSCTKEDYVFYCMMIKPELYEETINKKIFIESLMKIDPNKTDKKTIYDLLVEYTLFKSS